MKKWAGRKIILCPACGKSYEYCHGNVKIPYFRHADKTQCENLYSEPESNEHLQGKKDLYEWIKRQDGVTDVKLEGWLPETKQRPDVMFKYSGKQYAIEYQCSPISSEYDERHELYQAAGIIDIWICGVQNYWDVYHCGNGYKKISHLEKSTKQIYYNPITNGFYKVDHDIDNRIAKRIHSLRFKPAIIENGIRVFDYDDSRYIYTKSSYRIPEKDSLAKFYSTETTNVEEVLTWANI